MPTYSFQDDYSEGCHPEILDALVAANLDQQSAYGNDAYSAEARSLIAAACGSADVPIFFVSGGTLANLTISAAALRPHEAIISADTGHMATHETGAIEATGHKIIIMPAEDGKLTPQLVEAAVAANGRYPHQAKPRLVYISNSTEIGTVYSADELRALRSVCDTHDLLFLIDGARLAVALQSSYAGGATLETIAEVADVFWIGGTKAGTLLGEAIVIPNATIAHEFAFHLKQRGALLAKGRVLGVQFLSLFRDGLFEQAAVHANAMARTLSEGVVAAGHELAAATQSNQVFPVLPNEAIERLQEEFAFYVWRPVNDNASVVRLVTSWATDAARVDRFVALLNER